MISMISEWWILPGTVIMGLILAFLLCYVILPYLVDWWDDMRL